VGDQDPHLFSARTPACPCRILCGQSRRRMERCSPDQMVFAFARPKTMAKGYRRPAATRRWIETDRNGWQGRQRRREG
jgi:hypothetical protein